MNSDDGTRSIRLLDDLFAEENLGISVWLCQLDRLMRELPDLDSCLPNSERQHAERFRSTVHRGRYLASRYFERTVLGGALNLSSKSVCLERTPSGRPFVPGSAVHYSLSHSEDVAVIAVGPRELGIDIEHLREVSDADELARRFLHQSIASLITQLPVGRRSRTFLQYWTVCEAVLKANGNGLQGCISDLVFGLEHESEVLSNGRRWRTTIFSPEEGVTGAIAIAHSADESVNPVSRDPLSR